MREIITLQLGNLSNYVANHFWNAQESYFTYSEQDSSPVDHNIHWRTGLGSDGSDTFLPRTVIYDLKGGFGTLKKINALYEDASQVSASSTWGGPSAVHKQEALHPSAYQQSLDAGTEAPRLTKSSVRYWSDFSRVYYHPKSLVQLYDYELNSTIMPFERHSMGIELFHSLDKEHDIVDRDWRPFVEECDQMQGMQVLSTIDDAWGGFASSYVEALRDEYPKTCIWLWGIQNPILSAPRDKRQLRLANTAQALTRTREHASIMVPLAVPEGDLPSSIGLDASSSWHSSALLATAVETASLPSRLKQQSTSKTASLSDMAESLNVAGNQTLATMKMTVGPKAAPSDDDGLNISLSRLGLMKPQTRSRDPRVFGLLSVYRGTKIDTEEDEAQDAKAKRRIIGNTVIQRYTTDLGFPSLDSFPSIYTDKTEDDSRMNVRATVSTDDSIVEQMRTLRSHVTWSVGPDERETLSNDLAEMADAYHDDWSSGSDEDDDDL
ncbi:tubulin domain-containing protein [Stachybotrys elegans]|uniref:Tubulin domain-containing protein n=1 Tax=Stachybotrys elegans TaxID=80388 RepID=A0A8K0WQM4_9HYPO|nr:tubulin domain-containing protein [Stachybotrys elegans]